VRKIELHILDPDFDESTNNEDVLQYFKATLQLDRIEIQYIEVTDQGVHPPAKFERKK
jgi:hypothetical protein